MILKNRLQGTFCSRFINELVTNSIHFPIVYILIEIIIEGPILTITKIDLWASVVGAVLQALLISYLFEKQGNYPLVSQLIGPGIYTFLEIIIERSNYVFDEKHLAYWLFSITIGIIHSFVSSFKISKPLGLLIENTVRVQILTIGYWYVEVSSKNEYKNIWDFVHESSHVFVIFSLTIMGVLLGISRMNQHKDLIILRKTAQELETYSRWLLGQSLLEKAFTDPTSLKISRVNRSIIFMDIRGFTAWSEKSMPETVVDMLNKFYENSEKVWTNFYPTKVKLTADEIMLVFSDSNVAVKCAVELMNITREFLVPYELSAGIGVNSGQSVEGLIGSESFKFFDIIGDPVNVAKRLCDQAMDNQILMTKNVAINILDNQITDFGYLKLKGKEKPIQVYSLKY